MRNLTQEEIANLKVGDKIARCVLKKQTYFTYIGESYKVCTIDYLSPKRKNVKFVGDPVSYPLNTSYSVVTPENMKEILKINTRTNRLVKVFNFLMLSYTNHTSANVLGDVLSYVKSLDDDKLIKLCATAQTVSSAMRAAVDEAEEYRHGKHD